MGQDDVEGGGKDRKVSAQVGKAPTHLPIGGTDRGGSDDQGRPPGAACRGARGPGAGRGLPVGLPLTPADVSLRGSGARPGTPSNECGGAGPRTHRGVLGPSLLCGRREADLDLTAGVGCTPGGSRRGLRAPVRSLVQRGPLPPGGRALSGAEPGPQAQEPAAACRRQTTGLHES